ncbi:MAG: hypothetical protein HDR06_14615 [Lachnospiraceae bacterium]|nr:hypothetical protein [Lachnospiraceae bacterium]
MKKNDILKEHSVTIAIIISILISAILSFADLISDEKVLGYLLCADAGLAISVFFSSIKNEKNIDTLKNQLETQITSKKVTRKEHYQLLDAASINAKSEIWIMTIDTALNSKVVSTIPERELYYQSIETIAKTKREISIRRIYGLPVDEVKRADKLAWIRSDLEKFKDCPNYHMRIFDWRKFTSIPTPLSLQIIDDSFVGLVNMQQASASVFGSGEDICIKDKNIVQHLKIYYEAIWNKCDELKTGGDIKYDSLC